MCGGHDSAPVVFIYLFRSSRTPASLYRLLSRRQTYAHFADYFIRSQSVDSGQGRGVKIVYEKIPKTPSFGALPLILNHSSTCLLVIFSLVGLVPGAVSNDKAAPCTKGVYLMIYISHVTKKFEGPHKESRAWTALSPETRWTILSGREQQTGMPVSAQGA